MRSSTTRSSSPSGSISRSGSRRDTMESITAPATVPRNQSRWLGSRRAPSSTEVPALPEYGPLAPTEESLGLLDATQELRALELGCGSGHSLRYLAERGARELWGIDLSPVQISFAEETLRPFAPRVRLIESPMEVDPANPIGLLRSRVLDLWLGWTTDLPATMALVARYLRPGGCFIISGEHPAYSCLEWNGTQYHSSRNRTSPRALTNTDRGRGGRS